MKTSAVKITKKEFNATLVAERTAQIACCNGKVNRLNDIVAVLNDTEKMQNVKDNAEWRTVTKTRANGVVFSNGSTLDYKANAEYYRVGNVIIVVNVSEMEDFDAAYNRVNVPYYNVMAYLIDVPEQETPTKTDNTMKANNTYNVVIVNEACNFTATKYNTTLTGFTTVEDADNAAWQALRDIQDEIGYNKTEKRYNETLGVWVLYNPNNGAWLLTAKIEKVTDNTTPATSDTMNTETKTMNEVATVEFSELSHAGQCTDIYLHNTAEIYERYTVEAVRYAAGLAAFGWDYVTETLMNGAKVNGVEVVNEAVKAAVKLVKKYDHMTPTAKDIHEVTRNYAAYIVESAKYEVENA